MSKETELFEDIVRNVKSCRNRCIHNIKKLLPAEGTTLVIGNTEIKIEKSGKVDEQTFTALDYWDIESLLEAYQQVIAQYEKQLLS